MNMTGSLIRSGLNIFIGHTTLKLFYIHIELVKILVDPLFLFSFKIKNKL